jgi:site-specific recombinase XerD
MRQEIIKLTNDCLDYFNRNGFTQDRIDDYKSMWKKGILAWMQDKNLTEYTAELGKEFIDSFIREGYVSTRERDYIRSVEVLTGFMNFGYVRNMRTHLPVEYPLDGEIGRQMRKFISHLRRLRRSRSTVHSYELYLHRFLTFLKHERVYTVASISERHILKFVSTTENNKIHIVSCLRVLFRFWFEQHIVTERFHELLDNFKWVKQEKIPSFYTAAEISAMEKSAERSSGAGKRNYAMLLLASRLGLRASDIAGLKFSHIDWDKNEINLAQHKTGNPISLPLLSDVGNAIIDYLKNGRFNSASQHVFLTARPPYIPTTCLMVCSAIRDIILKSGVSVKNRHHGPHSLRHSLACRQLENNVSVHVISEILGHTVLDSTMSYLRIDLTSLLKCSLPVPSVPDFFYMQKGGVFYA